MINRILDIISNYVDTPKESYNEDSNVFDLGVDSLRMLRIVMDIEDFYNIRIENDEIVDIKCALDIEKIILEKRA